MNGEQRYEPDSDFFKFSKHSVTVKAHIKVSSIFELKSLFMSCEFNIPDVITFYGFLPLMKISAIYP